MAQKHKKAKKRSAIVWLSVPSISWDKMIEQIEREGREKLLIPSFLPLEFTLRLKEFSFPLVCRIQDSRCRIINFSLPFTRLVVEAKIKSNILGKELELEYKSKNRLNLPTKLSVESISFQTVRD